MKILSADDSKLKSLAITNDEVSKIIQNLLYLLFAFEIFEIAQKTKKLALSRDLLGSSQGCL